MPPFNSSLPYSVYSADTTTSVSSSTLVSLPPTKTDAPNETNQDSIYKITLRHGMDLWNGTVPFDRQESFGALQTGFPSSQTVEYENKKPLQFPSIIGRIATNVEIAPATTYKISNFGTQTGARTFEDRIVYDPLGCRSRLSKGNGWYYAGAPSLGRDAGLKYLINVKWYFEGTWSKSDPSNRLDMYVNQYRSGTLLRAYQVARSNNADSCFISGERTFFGNTLNFSEDFDPSTDDFEVEVANMARRNEVRIGLGQCELRFILAQ